MHMAYRKYFIILILIVFSFLNVVTFVTRVPAEGLSDIFGAIIPPGAAPGDSVGQQVVGSPTPLPGTGTPTGPITPPVGTPTPTPASPITGLRYYPQCVSGAYPDAYWSNDTMLGCGTYCDFGCGMSSAAMVFSNLGTTIKDPKQFLGAYTSAPYNSPDCNLRYAILSNMFEDNGIQTENPIAWPAPQPLHSGAVKTLVDGYLTAGYSIFVYGTTWWTGGSSRHAVWIVGKNGSHYDVMDPYWGAPPNSNGPPFPIVPYSSSRYVDIKVWSILPVKTRP